MSTKTYTQLSILAQTVLALVVASIGFFIWKVLLAIYRLLKRIVWKARKPSRSTRIKVTDSATSTNVKEVNEQSNAKSIAASNKQYGLRARTQKAKKQEDGKIVENALYISALKNHRDTVTGFDWAHDGSTLASACEDRTVRVFSFPDQIDKGIGTKQVNIPAVPVDVGFLHSNKKLVVLCKGLLDVACLFFYNNEESELGGMTWNCTKKIEKLFGQDPPLKLLIAIHSSNSKVLIIACSVTKEAKIYDQNGVELSSIAPNSFRNYDIAASYEAKLASVATFTADAKVWELQFSRDGIFRGSPKVMDLRGHKSKVNTVAISMDASRAVSVSEDGIMKIWNTDVNYQQQEDPRCLLTVKLDLPEGQCYTRLAFGPSLALAAVVRNTLHFLDIETGAVITSIEQAHDSQITSVQWAPVQVPCVKGNVRVLASSSKDKRVRMWAHPYDI